jgi:hypothetical protein
MHGMGLARAPRKIELCAAAAGGGGAVTVSLTLGITLGFVNLGFNCNFHELEYKNVHSSFNRSQTCETRAAQVHQKLQKPESIVWSPGLVDNTNPKRLLRAFLDCRER